MTWEGRELQTFRRFYTGYDVYTQLVYYNQLSFTYNADGIRTSKTVDGIKHTYILSGSQILAETWTKSGVEYTIQYVYDELGAPVGLQYRTSAYTANEFDCFFFERNLQGDIVAVYNEDGKKICSYTYDAWGVCTTTVTSGVTTLERSIANTYNPFRYRGYFYDVESGYYYLQSRYYNPNWGRFLNADSAEIILASPTGLTDKNLYAYCDNNPIMRTDGDGDFWETAFDIVSLGFSIADVCMNPNDPWAWAGLVGDALDLIPFVTGVGEVTRAINVGRKVTNAIVDAADAVHDTVKAIDNVQDVAATAQKGWRVGDDITALTKAGKSPSWSTVRRRYWKNEAFYNAANYSTENLTRMKKGLAALDSQGIPMELHHPYGRKGANFYVFEPLTQFEHRGLHYGW